MISTDQRREAELLFLLNTVAQTFIDKMVQCGFCGASGHTIRTCSATGVEEERQRQSTDPKCVAQKEKAAQKRAEKNESESRRLQLTADPKSLHVPEVKPGHIKTEYGETARNIRGAIDLALPKEYLTKILRIINENRLVLLLSFAYLFSSLY